jgi:uncharacterized protein YndB with AHSA1/START domain
MLKKISIGLGAGCALLLITIALQPATFHIERSITVAAPPESVFAQVNDFHAWTAWSPWEKRDPAMTRSYEGAPAGASAKYAWAGNREVGAGRMTIEQSTPSSQIVIKLEFLEPFAATHTATFTFRKTPDGTKTTWAMDGSNTFVGKAMHLVMDMDKMVGPDFERGLASLKAVSEKAAAAPAVANVTP